MPIISDILAYKKSLSQGKIMALDLGTKRIGVADCDQSQTLTTPRIIISRSSNKKDFEDLLNYIKQNHITAIIIGFPTHMDGTEIKMTKFVKTFAENFLLYLNEHHLNLPIIFHDERLSSFEAEEIAKDIKTRKKQKHHDDIAASIILESFLLKLKS